MQTAKNIIPIIGIVTVILCTACSCNTAVNNESKEVKEVKEAITKNSIVADKYVGKLDELLTLEMAAETAGLPAAEAKKSPDTEKEKKINKFSLTYSWKNKTKLRTIEVMKQKITTPVNDDVELSWVKNTTLEQFKQQNKKPTEADKAQAKNAVNEKVEELQNDGKASGEAATTANDIAQKALDNYSVEEVPNVGEYALFTNTKFAGVPLRELKAFYNGISFQVRVDVNNNSKVNDAKAIALAQRIINEKLK